VYPPGLPRPEIEPRNDDESAHALAIAVNPAQAETDRIGALWRALGASRLEPLVSPLARILDEETFFLGCEVVEALRMIGGDAQIPVDVFRPWSTFPRHEPHGPYVVLEMRGREFEQGKSDEPHLDSRFLVQGFDALNWTLEFPWWRHVLLRGSVFSVVDASHSGHALGRVTFLGHDTVGVFDFRSLSAHVIGSSTETGATQATAAPKVGQTLLEFESWRLVYQGPHRLALRARRR
jgi:hypothetical protein